MTEHIVPALLTLVLAATVQASIGFGAGMVSVPLLVLAGVPLHQAMGLILPSNSVQTAVNCWQHRRELEGQLHWFMFGLRVCALVVGVGVLKQLIVDPVLAKRVMGGALLLALAVSAWFRVSPRKNVPIGWTIVAGLTSGFTAGLVMMGGPPLVLWVVAHDWSPNRQRSFMWAQFLLLMPLHAIILSLQFGMPVIQSLAWGILFTPAGFAGAWLGGVIGARMSRQRLRWGMLGLLIIVGVYALMGGTSRFAG